jgi:transposase
MLRMIIFFIYFLILLFIILYCLHLGKMNSILLVKVFLILDNARIHHDEDLINYIEAFCGHVEFLPPYSPDFNPIESLFF